MVIAVDIRGSNAYQKFISNVFPLITSQHTEDTFVFIVDRPFHYPIIGNTVIENIKERSSFLSAIGLQNKLSYVLKKYNASVLVTCKPFNTNVPVCLIVEEKTNAKYFLKSKTIISASEFNKNQIAEKYQIDSNKINEVYRPVNNNYKSVDFDEREKVKETFANGNEYFIARIPTELKDHSANLLVLLKAFSKFKKMQKSNMRLLIVSSEPIDKGFKDHLRLYKFNSEVILLERQSEAELLTVVASAYAAIYPFNTEDDYSVLVQLMQSDIPIITSNIPLISEICGNAAIYFKASDISIADKMMLVFKDESLRQELIENGRDQLKKFTSQASAELLWNSIQKATL